MTVIIGIDPHKRSHTAVALDEDDEQLDELRVVADRRQVDRLLAWAARWPDRLWAIENANGLGWLLSRQLVDAGEQVRDVPPTLSAEVRKLSGSGHKTDAHDARSTAIAGCRAKVLRTVVPDGAPQLLGVLVERRWHIVDTRQKTLVRVHEQLVKLQPGGYSKRLSADKVAELLRSIRPTDDVSAQRRQVVKELLVDLRRLDKQRKQADADLDQALADYGTSLLDIDGIGRVAAATIIAIVGDVRRSPRRRTSRRSLGPRRSRRPRVRRSATGLTSTANGRATRSCTRPRRSRPAWPARPASATSTASSPRARPDVKPPARSSGTWPTRSTAPCGRTSRTSRCPGRTDRPRESSSR